LPSIAKEGVPSRDERGPVVARIEVVVATDQTIVTAPADQEISIHVVLTRATVQLVVAAHEDVIAGRADEGISFQIVVSGASVNDVVPRPTADQIVPIASIDLVIAPETLDHVIAGRPNDDVVPLGPNNRGNAFVETEARDYLGSGGSRESKQRYQHDHACGARRCTPVSEWT